MVEAKEQEKKFYVYVHRYASGPKDGEIFYVGKGSGDRLKNKNRSYNPHWTNVVNKYDYKPEIVIRFNSEFCALSFEIALIDFIGIENLTNITKGGCGLSGYSHTEESKKKMSEIMIGNKNAVGCVPSEEARCKIRLTKLADKNPNYDFKIHTFQHKTHGIVRMPQNEFKSKFLPDKNNISLLVNGRLPSYHGWWMGIGPKPEHDDKERARKSSETRRGIPVSQETRDKISKSKTGKIKRKEVYDFYHKDHGVVSCTMYDLYKKFNLNSGGVWNLAKGIIKSHKGWTLNR